TCSQYDLELTHDVSLTARVAPVGAGFSQAFRFINVPGARPDEEISTDTVLVDRRARRAARTPDYPARPVILPVDGSGRRQRVECLAPAGRARQPNVRLSGPTWRPQRRQARAR